MAIEVDAFKVLGFELSKQMFALDISAVREVVEWSGLTAVPKAPSCALGVFNYHGKVIAVVNPAHFFKLEPSRVSQNTRIVILSGEDFSLGFQVDSASRIESVPREALHASKEGISEKGFIRAVVRLEDRLYNLVDPEPLLDAIEEEFSAANLW